MAAFKRGLVVSWVVFTVAVAVTSLGLALLIRFRALGGRTHLLGPGDQAPVLSGLLAGGDFSSYYCRELDVSVDQSSSSSSSRRGGGPAVFNAYAVSARPERSGESRRDRVRLVTGVSETTGVSPPFAFNLHGGSGPVSWLKLHACSNRTALNLYRCQDEASAAAWSSTGDNRQCWPVCLYSRCGVGTENYCSLLADQKVSVDEFVFVLAARVTGSRGLPPGTGGRDDAVLVDASVTRHPYDLRVHSSLCLNASSACRLPVSPGETRAVVLEIPSDVTAGSIALRTECRPRAGIYVAFHLGVPLAAVLAGSVLVFLPCLLLQRTLRRQAFELRVKGLGSSRRHTPDDRDGAGLVDNEYLSEN